MVLDGVTKMKTFRVRFHGRTKNAIGVCYWITDIIQAAKIEDVRIALYDKYEHISHLTAEELE